MSDDPSLSWPRLTILWKYWQIWGPHLWGTPKSSGFSSFSSLKWPWNQVSIGILGWYTMVYYFWKKNANNASPVETATNESVQPSNRRAPRRTQQLKPCTKVMDFSLLAILMCSWTANDEPKKACLKFPYNPYNPIMYRDVGIIMMLLVC